MCIGQGKTHTHTDTDLIMHVKWKVSGPVHCLGNGRLAGVVALRSNDVITNVIGVSSGQTPFYLLYTPSVCPKRMCDGGPQPEFFLQYLRCANRQDVDDLSNLMALWKAFFKCHQILDSCEVL